MPPVTIKKPLGEVGKNYKLCQSSRLDSDTYNDIEVRPLTVSQACLLIFGIIEIRVGIGPPAFEYDCDHLESRAFSPEPRIFGGLPPFIRTT